MKWSTKFAASELALLAPHNHSNRFALTGRRLPEAKTCPSGGCRVFEQVPIPPQRSGFQRIFVGSTRNHERYLDAPLASPRGWSRCERDG